MFILNGELVTIISNRFGKFRSIRFKLFLALFSIGLMSVILLSVVFISSTNQRYITEKKKELYRQGNTIAISLVTTGYFSEEKDKSYLATIQASVPGRGLVIDSRANILFDTNHLDDGKSYPTKQVMDALDGYSSYYYMEEKNIGTVTVPITDLDFDTVIGVVVVSESFREINDSIRELVNLTLLVAVALIVLDSLISYYISSSFNKPFKSLITHMNRVTDGHVNERIDIKGNTEIEEIVTSFNLMISELESIESNRKQFVANVSHELKTPLSSVKVLAESLLHQPNVPIDIYQDFLSDINQEIDRETKIINDLLTLVTIGKQVNPLRIDEVVINDLIEQVMKRLKPIADLKHIQMFFESFRVVIAEVDQTKMELVLTNLIENAIKYNNEFGVINVKLDTNYKDFVISVRDSGEGIPPESVDLVFKRFYRVDKTRSRDTGGTGLGLSIVQRSVHMHKGSIKCKSELGKWTEFTIKIPLTHITKRDVENEENNFFEDKSKT